MWFISDVLTINMLSSFFGLFFQADYSSDITFHLNIKVVEKKMNAQNFEFPSATIEATNVVSQNQFPDRFLLGAASSAYQVEGAFNYSDKGPSVWDYWTHENPNLIIDKSNGDVACDSFNKQAIDVELLKNIEANVYRFSLSWSRILPNGMTNSVSLEGVRYYNELINNLLLNGITPMVTMHHFDIPLKLQLLGGWTSPKMIEYFENYARLVFAYFGDRVKYWITINDPYTLCNIQFGDSQKPLYNESGTGNYLCGHHVLLAHARVYNLYRNEFQWLQNGKVGISLSGRWFEPEDYTSPEDAEAAEVSFQFANYWFINPLLSDLGNYPDIMRLEIELKSALQRFRGSRLPSFDQDQIKMIKSSLDFLGIEFFTTYSVRSLSVDPNTLHKPDTFTRKESLESDMAATWLPYDEAFGIYDVKNTPENFGKLLRRFNSDYILPQVFITANGYADAGESHDVDRALYHYDHLSELLEAMKSGVDVRGYVAWSLMDSFEWKDGYSKRYGLYNVDFDDKNRTRKEKLSAKILRNIYKTKKVPENLTTKV